MLLSAGLLGVKDHAEEDLVSLLPLSSCGLHAEDSTNPNQGSSTTSASEPCRHDDDKGRRGEPVSLISCRSLHFSPCCPCLVSSISLICLAHLASASGFLPTTTKPILRIRYACDRNHRNLCYIPLPRDAACARRRKTAVFSNSMPQSL